MSKEGSAVKFTKEILQYDAGIETIKANMYAVFNAFERAWHEEGREQFGSEGEDFDGVKIRLVVETYKDAKDEQLQ